MFYDSVKNKWGVNIPPSLTENGKRKKELFATEEEAEARQAEVDSLKLGGTSRRSTEAVRITWQDLLNNARKFRWSLASDGVKTEGRATVIINALKQRHQSPHTFTYADLESIYDDLVNTRTPNTVQKYLDSFGGMMREGRKRGDMSNLSQAQVPRLHKQKKNARVTWFSAEECKQIFNTFEEVIGLSTATDRQARIYLELLLETGCRTTEILQLSVKELRLKAGTLYIPPDVEKTDTGRTVPLTSRAKELFKQHMANLEAGTENGHCLSGIPLFPAINYNTLKNRWNRIRAHLNQTENKEFIMYLFRHTCACRLVQSKIHLLTIKDWLGHAQVETTLTYAKLFPDQLKEAATQVAVSWE